MGKQRRKKIMEDPLWSFAPDQDVVEGVQRVIANLKSTRRAAINELIRLGLPAFWGEVKKQAAKNHRLHSKKRNNRNGRNGKRTKNTNESGNTTTTQQWDGGSLSAGHPGAGH
jgi:hypothetical protein